MNIMEWSENKTDTLGKQCKCSEFSAHLGLTAYIHKDCAASSKFHVELPVVYGGLC